MPRRSEIPRSPSRGGRVICPCPERSSGLVRIRGGEQRKRCGRWGLGSRLRQLEEVIGEQGFERGIATLAEALDAAVTGGEGVVEGGVENLADFAPALLVEEQRGTDQVAVVAGVE